MSTFIERVFGVKRKPALAHWDAPPAAKPKPAPKAPAKPKPKFAKLVIETPWYRLPVRSF